MVTERKTWFDSPVVGPIHWELGELFQAPMGPAHEADHSLRLRISGAVRQVP